MKVLTQKKKNVGGGKGQEKKNKEKSPWLKNCVKRRGKMKERPLKSRKIETELGPETKPKPEPEPEDKAQPNALDVYPQEEPEYDPSKPLLYLYQLLGLPGPLNPSFIDSGLNNLFHLLPEVLPEKHKRNVRMILNICAAIDKRYICAPNREGVTPLLVAAQFGSFTLFKEYVMLGGNIWYYTQKFTCLSIALECEHEDIAEEIMRLDTKKTLINTESEGWYPILIASNHGLLKSVKNLVRHGAKVNQEGLSRYTPLLLAVLGKHLQMIEYLLELGAHPDVYTNDGSSLMSIAAGRGDWKTLYLLIIHRAAYYIGTRAGESEIDEALIRVHAALSVRSEEAKVVYAQSKAILQYRHHYIDQWTKGKILEL